jgi:hypothetical protein
LSAPAVRAHFLKLSLRALDRAEPALRERAHALLGAELSEIASARGLSWLPLERLLAMSAAAAEYGGEEALRALVHDTMRLAFESPVWHRVIRIAIDTFGLRPPQVARWAPSIYRLAFRGTGKMRVERADDNGARVVFEGVPAVCYEHPAYVAALAHALEFFFELTETSGSVTHVPAPERRADLVFDLNASCPGPCP